MGRRGRAARELLQRRARADHQDGHPAGRAGREAKMSTPTRDIEISKDTGRLLENKSSHILLRGTTDQIRAKVGRLPERSKGAMTDITGAKWALVVSIKSTFINAILPSSSILSRDIFAETNLNINDHAYRELILYPTLLKRILRKVLRDYAYQ